MTVAHRSATADRAAPRPDAVDAGALAADLRRHTRGEVRFDDGDRALYATDSSNYRQVPIGVVIPRTIADIVQTLAVARQHGAPVLMRGGGTSLAGQCCNVAVVVDCSKYLRRVLSFDPRARRAVVEPGCVGDTLNGIAKPHGLMYGPVPATHEWCTFGGMIGNNSCGVHSVMSGRTADNVEELDVLTYDGLRLRVGATSDEDYERIVGAGGRRAEIYRSLRDLRDRYADLIRTRFPKIPRRVSGYGLDQLLPENGFHVARALVGSESTCVAVLEATVRLVPVGPSHVLVVLGYPDVYAAADAVPQVLAHRPTALEGLDDRMVRKMVDKRIHPDARERLPEGGGWLLVDFDGADAAQAKERAGALVEEVRRSSRPPAVKLTLDQDEQERLWAIREGGLGATAWGQAGEERTWEGWEDSAVPPERFGDYLRELRGLMERYGYSGVFYGHFGDGCLHTRIDFDLQTAPGITRFRHFIDAAADLVASYGGSMSGEHGDGQSKAALLPKMYGPELVEAFREFKRIWDPGGRMNPGKVVDPYDPIEDLRLGAAYAPPRLSTHFAFPDDEGSFANAALRCVGVGKCRVEGGATMCPSYMVTKEEKHTTRGRARLLFEMLEGAPLERGWKDEHVHEALDLCLSCKGCKGDCPVKVDMATYKAEFLSHYYAGRLRPRHAYAFGLIFLWARLASRAPWLVNTVGASPVTGPLAKWLAGMHPNRRMPRFAPRTFRKIFSDEPHEDPAARPAVLWADTFNEHFHPETLVAAAKVLRTVGYRPIVPRRVLCCGRPLYDYGFLDMAKRLLQDVLRTLRAEIRAGLPIVVLEPSCAATFRDELTNLFPHDEDARRLRDQTILLSELIAKEEGFSPPLVGGRAIVHGHCHQKALMGMDGEMKVLERLGVDARLLDSGCCGMAGAFGFEKEHYDVAMKAGERVLLPEVRRAPAETLLVADGFSCREQIEQGAGRRATHLAEIVASAI